MRSEIAKLNSSPFSELMDLRSLQLRTPIYYNRLTILYFCVCVLLLGLLSWADHWTFALPLVCFTASFALYGTYVDFVHTDWLVAEQAKVDAANDKLLKSLHLDEDTADGDDDEDDGDAGDLESAPSHTRRVTTDRSNPALTAHLVWQTKRSADYTAATRRKTADEQDTELELGSPSSHFSENEQNEKIKASANLHYFGLFFGIEPDFPLVPRFFGYIMVYGALLLSVVLFTANVTLGESWWAV